MAKRKKPVSPGAGSLSAKQRALVTTIIAQAVVAAQQSAAAAPRQAPALDPAAIRAALEYGHIKRALRTHSEP